MQGDAGAQVAGALLGVLCALGFGLLVGILFGAVVLRAACSLYNKLASPQSSVPAPGFGKALGITALSLIANVIAGALLGGVLAGGALAAGAQAKNFAPAAQLIPSLVSLPVGILVMSGLLTVMLPTTFGRALLVTLIQYAIMMVIGVVVAVVIGVIVVGLGVGLAGK